MKISQKSSKNGPLNGIISVLKKKNGVRKIFKNWIRCCRVYIEKLSPTIMTIHIIMISKKSLSPILMATKKPCLYPKGIFFINSERMFDPGIYQLSLGWLHRKGSLIIRLLPGMVHGMFQKH